MLTPVVTSMTKTKNSKYGGKFMNRFYLNSNVLNMLSDRKKQKDISEEEENIIKEAFSAAGIIDKESLVMDAMVEELINTYLMGENKVMLQFHENDYNNGNIIIPDNGHLTHTISYDEKPDIQAVANKYTDHNPTEENGYIRRDYEYVRLGTLSLLANIRCTSRYKMQNM